MNNTELILAISEEIRNELPNFNEEHISHITPSYYIRINIEIKKKLIILLKLYETADYAHYDNVLLDVATEYDLDFVDIMTEIIKLVEYCSNIIASSIIDTTNSTDLVIKLNSAFMPYARGNISTIPQTLLTTIWCISPFTWYHRIPNAHYIVSSTNNIKDDIIKSAIILKNDIRLYHNLTSDEISIAADLPRKATKFEIMPAPRFIARNLQEFIDMYSAYMSKYGKIFSCTIVEHNRNIILPNLIPNLDPAIEVI